MRTAKKKGQSARGHFHSLESLPFLLPRSLAHEGRQACTASPPTCSECAGLLPFSFPFFFFRRACPSACIKILCVTVGCLSIPYYKQSPLSPPLPSPLSPKPTPALRRREVCGVSFSLLISFIDLMVRGCVGGVGGGGGDGVGKGGRDAFVQPTYTARSHLAMPVPPPPALRRRHPHAYDLWDATVFNGPLHTHTPALSLYSSFSLSQSQGNK